MRWIRDLYGHSGHNNWHSMPFLSKMANSRNVDLQLSHSGVFDPCRRWLQLFVAALPLSRFFGRIRRVLGGFE